MFRSLRSVLLVAICALIAVSAAPAFAAPATWRSIDVTLHPEQSGGVMMISGELPPTAKLPAQAELSVPTGNEVQWIGEILGGASAADPTLKYTKTVVGATDFYRFTLANSRIAQIEIPSTTGQTIDGATYNDSLKWTATQDVPEVRVSVRVPVGAKIVQEVPGATIQTGDATNSYYTKTFKDVKAGDALDLTFAYTAAPVAPAAAGAVASSSDSTALIIFFAVALGIAALVTVAVRRKMKTRIPAERAATIHARAAANKSQRANDVAPASALTGRAKRNLVTGGIVAVLVLAAGIVGTQATKPKLEGDSVTRTFSQAAPCANATIALTVPGGSDPMATAEKIFAVLKPISGMTSATYNVKNSSVEVGFCESTSNEAAIRSALVPTGFIATAGAEGGS